MLKTDAYTEQYMPHVITGSLHMLERSVRIFQLANDVTELLLHVHAASPSHSPIAKNGTILSTCMSSTPGRTSLKDLLE